MEKTGPRPACWMAMVFTIGLGVNAAGCDNRSHQQAPPGAAAPEDKQQSPAPGAPAPVVKTPAATSKAIAKGLDGLYMIVRFSGSSISQFYYYFTPEGNAYLGIPRGGMEKFDFAEAGRTEPDITGTYTISGEKITVTLADGKTRELRYGLNEKGETMLEGLFAHKARSFSAGTTFDGNYFGGAASRGGGSFAASGQTYTFKPDGTFQHSGVGSIQSSTDRIDVSASSTSADSGTYKVAGNTLELKHADGKTTRHTIFPYEDYDKNIQLNIDGAMFKPQ